MTAVISKFTCIVIVPDHMVEIHIPDVDYNSPTGFVGIRELISFYNFETGSFSTVILSSGQAIQPVHQSKINKQGPSEHK